MAKYGLLRGVRGSDARHIATPQYYRDLHVKNEDLRADIAELEETKESWRREVAELAEREQQARTRTEQATAEKQRAETELAGKQSELQKVRGELKTDKFKSSAAEAGTKFANTVGSLLGSSKIERQQQAIDTLTAENEAHKQDIARLTQTIARERSEHQKTVGDLKAELDKIDEWLPDTKSLVKWGEHCRRIGFSDSQAKELIAMKPVRFTGELYSNEHSQRFKATDAEARLERRDNAFRLFIDGTGIIQWFRQKHQEFLQRLGIKVPERGQRRGQGV